MSGTPSKSEITQIFKRLRSVPANKLCFDCHSKNPTWSSVTYGIFICIDCSGIHRSLGVHLTFVRSTQLDSNWTWQQLRQMQLGGNANAETFFRQHNVNSTDTQMKYKSRAAQLYRDKLHHAANQAMRTYGTQLFIDAPQNSKPEKDEENDATPDFFDGHDQQRLRENGEPVRLANPNHISTTPLSSDASLNAVSKQRVLADDGSVPSVDAALSASPSEALKQQAERKPTIGQRKTNAKKSGLGGKKGGLGAQKVKKDFAEIEMEAEMADQLKHRMKEQQKVSEEKRAQDEAKAMANMKLAYQDLSLEVKRKEEKLRGVDSKRADQIERLGMGAMSSKTGISHYALNQMNTIIQEEPSSDSRTYAASSSRKGFDDDFEKIDNDWKSLRSAMDYGNEKDEYFDGFGGEVGKSNWEKEYEVMKTTTPSKPSWSNNFDDKSVREERLSRSRGDVIASSSSFSGTDEVQKKFGNAKAISSDMFFGNQDNSGPDANLSKFQGSSSISSNEYFGRDERVQSQRFGSTIAAPDMEDVKESVRLGVSKVAGKLSNMASGVVTQLQDKYGY